MKRLAAFLATLYYCSFSKTDGRHLTYRASDVTCAELNQALEMVDSLDVKHSFLERTETHFRHKALCHASAIPVSGYLKARDGWCRAGFVCEREAP
jgi:hypothetical protein